MRETIIEYLQEMQCELFPVEWDRFVCDYMSIVDGMTFDEIAKNKIKYEFKADYCSVMANCGIIGPYTLACWHYGDLDRCKTLLLNAVRSAIESKDPAGHPRDYKVYISVSGIIKIVSFPKGGAWETVVWQNGEFK